MAFAGDCVELNNGLSSRFLRSRTLGSPTIVLQLCPGARLVMVR